ncbi:MAG: UPF0489 family protein [Clostridia bacterium]|nr:UPF0489 family protein [Clostridia bacterium]
MRVLDLDLDFFLADCCELAAPGERPPLSGHEPWEEARVRRFLEDNCGLSRESPVPGRVYATHDGSLRLWHELIEAGRLTVPFGVTHIDAHSDLGIGYPGPGFVLNSVLPLAPEKRADIDRYYRMKQLDEANYLLFALAFRWIDSLENVRNPRSRPDIPAFAAKDEHGSYSSIRLSSFTSALFEGRNGRESEIPFRVFDDYGSYCAPGKFDFISLAISPRYAPKEADALVSVIAEYIAPLPEGN